MLGFPKGSRTLIFRLSPSRCGTYLPSLLLQVSCQPGCGLRHEAGPRHTFTKSGLPLMFHSGLDVLPQTPVLASLPQFPILPCTVQASSLGNFLFCLHNIVQTPHPSVDTSKTFRTLHFQTLLSLPDVSVPLCLCFWFLFLEPSWPLRV